MMIPGTSSRVPIELSVSSRKTAKNRTKLRISDKTIPAIFSPTPPNPPVTRPEATVETNCRTPKTTRSLIPRRREERKLARRLT